MDNKDQPLAGQLSREHEPPAFMIDGVNSTETIRNLTELNGIPILELERNMRDGLSPEEQTEGIEPIPENIDLLSKAEKQDLYWEYSDIFLGPHDSLINTFAEDNETVLNLGLTHQQLADFLDFFRLRQRNGTYKYNDRNYDLEVIGWRGSLASPFRDGTAGSFDYYLTCHETGEKLWYGGLLPQMIRRYGFYEGKGVYFRVDPRKIAEIAGFVPKVG